MTATEEKIFRALRFMNQEPPTGFNSSLTIPLSGMNRQFIYVTGERPQNATVTLPDATQCHGSWAKITNIGWTGSALTISPINGQKIFGSLCYNSNQYTLLNQGSIEVVSDGSNWVCTQGSGSEVFIETGWNSGSWYRKLSSDMVLMGGSSIIPGNTTSVHVTLPLSLRSGDWPVVVVTPHWSASSPPSLSFANGNSTGFDVFGRSYTGGITFNWFGYGYWR